MSMDCTAANDLITRSLSGNAAAPDESALRAHLAACPACSELRRSLAATWALMGQLPALAIEAEAPRVAPRKPLLWKVAAAAAVALFVLSIVSRTAPRVAAPALVQTPVEEPRPDQRSEEARVEQVLVEVEQEKVAPPAPAAPVAPEPTLVVKPLPEPKAPEAPAPAPREEVVKTPPAETRPEPRPAPAVPAPLPVVALLDRVEGAVFVLESGARQAATSGQPLRAGAALETSGKASQAVVEFADGSRLVLGADSAIDPIRLDGGKRVSLAKGVLAAQVAKQPAAEPMIFMTAAAEVRVVGTRLTLSVTPASARVEVREGKVRVTRRDDGAALDVPADHFVVAGKGLSFALKPVTTARIALRDTFDRARWGAGWTASGDPSVKLALENGSLSIKVLQKPVQDVTTGKMPTEAGEAARKALQGVQALNALGKREWPRAGWLETRQAYPFSNEAPLRLRTRVWNSHGDADRISWLAFNRGVAGQGLSLERRGDVLQLWVDGAAAPAWKKELPAAQEWESLELWLSKDQLIVRRNEETLFSGPNPLKVKAGTISMGANAKVELPQDEEARFDDLVATLVPRAEFDEVSR